MRMTSKPLVRNQAVVGLLTPAKQHVAPVQTSMTSPAVKDLLLGLFWDRPPFSGPPLRVIFVKRDQNASFQALAAFLPFSGGRSPGSRALHSRPRPLPVSLPLLGLKPSGLPVVCKILIDVAVTSVGHAGDWQGQRQRGVRAGPLGRD